MSIENEQEVLVDPILAKDQNYKAYKDIEELLKGSYVGQWVAFTKGELVLVEPDQTSLFQKLEKQYPNESAFVKEIVEKEEVIQL
jgi:hypothetical protein